MKLNNIWGYGQLFGYSAIDGPNRYYNDFVGTLTEKKIGIRFELKPWVKIVFPVRGRVKFNAVTGDMIDAQTIDGKFFLTFADNDTLVGYSPVLPKITAQKKLKHRITWGVDVYSTENDSFAIVVQELDGLYKFSIHHSFSVPEARSGANYYINADVEELKKTRYEYYKKMPKCKNKQFEKLYYKALSVNKVNVHSPEGKIPCMWTTPDRVPHRHMWLWDSVFHALAIVTYNEELAKNSIRAVLSQIRPDGFMPHQMSPTDSSDVTQPQVLAWGIWELYKKTGDKSLLTDNVDTLERYLVWDMENRDKNGNGLLEWLTEPDNLACKCGESGLDNSPRFDFAYEMDAVDFSTFACHDAMYLGYIFQEIGECDKAKKWFDISENIKKQMNKLLWNEQDGVYYDRLLNGEHSSILTPASFFPMIAKIPSKEQAEKMVRVLTDENLLWTNNPLATIAKSSDFFSTDMWRGGVWLNLNYFVIKGLKNYGFNDIANELIQKTLKMVDKWYKKTGAIFEFYDPNNEIAPYYCDRKGTVTKPLDWRKHVHSIVDFNWSACFTLMLIQDELYI